jgi:hypothetical protein
MESFLICRPVLSLHLADEPVFFLQLYSFKDPLSLICFVAALHKWVKLVDVCPVAEHSNI